MTQKKIVDFPCLGRIARDGHLKFLFKFRHKKSIVLVMLIIFLHIFPLNYSVKVNSMQIAKETGCMHCVMCRC